MSRIPLNLLASLVWYLGCSAPPPEIVSLLMAFGPCFTRLDELLAFLSRYRWRVEEIAQQLLGLLVSHPPLVRDDQGHRRLCPVIDETIVEKNSRRMHGVAWQRSTHGGWCRGTHILGRSSDLSLTPRETASLYAARLTIECTAPGTLVGITPEILRRGEHLLIGGSCKYLTSPDFLALQDSRVTEHYRGGLGVGASIRFWDIRIWDVR